MIGWSKRGIVSPLNRCPMNWLLRRWSGSRKQGFFYPKFGSKLDHLFRIANNDRGLLGLLLIRSVCFVNL